MIKDNLVLIKHIRDSIKKIEIYTKNYSKERLKESERTLDAVVRNLEIIGEAAKNIAEEFKKKYPNIEWRKMSGARDILIHAYFKVDLDKLWDMIKEDLPVLKKKIMEILKKENS